MSWKAYQDYWEKRWKKQGRETVGHVGASKKGFDEQTKSYSDAIRAGLLFEREDTFRHVLDFGCGWGRMYPLLSSLSEEYTGVDLAHEAVRVATAAHPQGHFHHWRNLMAKGRDGDFDAIVCCTVLQHIVDREILETTAYALSRMLADDGVVVLLENCSRLGDKPHICYRLPGAYDFLFPGLTMTHIKNVAHNGEDHALLHFRR
jgi:2-polyprenyl-3-methyl-5-hydroxy-6-metoxy-1,4-benzoquinol methylase